MSKVLVLRTADKNRQSYGGFQWPESGPVECSDWNSVPCCGNGLHGLLWGEGHWPLLSPAQDATWQVLEVEAESIVKIDSVKVKFPRASVVYSGNMGTAINMVLNSNRRFKEILNIAKDISSGDSSKAASSGNYSTAASSGNYSTAASSGASSKAASSGNSSKAASSGNSSKAASSGNYSTAASSGASSKAASSGNYSTAASSGNYSTAASSGNSSKAASSGNYSTAASSGNSSKAASSGASSISMACGIGCIVQAGENGCFATAWYDASKKRNRIKVGYVGRKGLKANTPYRVENGEWIEVKA